MRYSCNARHDSGRGATTHDRGEWPMSDGQRGRFHVWRGRYFDEIDLSLMTPMETAAYKSAFQAGLQARDAEVRALRLALSDILRRVTLPVLPSVNACELVLADVARAARAALREGGGE